ncbi:hypothetical protein ACLOJK_036344, partial [Asimina triloba]
MSCASRVRRTVLWRRTCAAMKVDQMALQPAVIGMMGCLARAELLAGVGEEGAAMVGGD